MYTSLKLIAKKPQLPENRPKTNQEGKKKASSFAQPSAGTQSAEGWGLGRWFLEHTQLVAGG